MQVESYTPVTGHKSILAKFNLRLGSAFLIRDCRLMQSAKGRWIAFPSRSYTDKEGKEKYFDYVIIDKDQREAVEKAIKDQLFKLSQPETQETFTEPPF